MVVCIPVNEEIRQSRDQKMRHIYLIWPGLKNVIYYGNT